MSWKLVGSWRCLVEGALQTLNWGGDLEQRLDRSFRSLRPQRLLQPQLQALAVHTPSACRGVARACARYTLPNSTSSRSLPNNALNVRSPVPGLSDKLFYLLFFGVLFWIILSFLRSVFRPPHPDQQADPPGPPPPRPPFFGRGYGDDDDDAPGFGGGPPPPPYSPYGRSPSPKPSAPASNAGGAGGFWTGLATGAAGLLAGQALMNRQTAAGQDRQRRSQLMQQQDVRPRRNRMPSSERWDRGEGPSSGSSFRTSTG